MPQLNIRGFDLDYDIAGSPKGTPLVWGHGLNSSRGISAAYPMVDLSPAQTDRQVVRYDTRGHGMSSMLADPAKGSWAELALDQIALIDALGFEQVVVGGVSMGAAAFVASMPAGWSMLRSRCALPVLCCSVVVSH